jgi:hypothetical protein
VAHPEALGVPLHGHELQLLRVVHVHQRLRAVLLLAALLPLARLVRPLPPAAPAQEAAPRLVHLGALLALPGGGKVAVQSLQSGRARFSKALLKQHQKARLLGQPADTIGVCHQRQTSLALLIGAQLRYTEPKH